jgi:hypothetical protein
MPLYIIREGPLEFLLRKYRNNVNKNSVYHILLSLVFFSFFILICLLFSYLLCVASSYCVPLCYPRRLYGPISNPHKLYSNFISPPEPENNTSVPNFMKIYQTVQKLLVVGT